MNYKYVSIGNPYLKPYYILFNNLQYQLNVPNLYLSTSAKFNYSFNPFMVAFVDRQDMIVRTWEYKDNSYYAGWDLSGRWTPYKWLALQPYLALGYTKLKNIDGSTVSDFTKMASGSVSFMYDKFKLTTQASTSFTNLRGDVVEKQGSYYIGEFSYSNKSLSLALQYIHNPNPTQSYSTNPIMKLREETIWYNFQNLMVVKAVYYFSFGKKNSIRVQQKLSNSDNDSGLREETKAK